MEITELVQTEKPVSTMVDMLSADAQYRSFPTFKEWARHEIDLDRWERNISKFKTESGISAEILRRARDVAKRAAAIDTGAIEGLYEVDRGFTFTVATQAAMWEVALNLKGPKVRSLIECQLQAYDYVLDFATKKAPTIEAWIRTLHSQLCHSQDTFTAVTEVGLQEQPLPKGEYKVLPNHVRQREGKIHSYAPVQLTPSEMHRLCTEVNTPDFNNAHPVLQASYAHYAFAAIHPFSDGNGRVARALASVYTYRSLNVPLLILAENRAEYIKSLEAADENQLEPFIEFVMERILDAGKFVYQSIKTALVPPADDAVSQLRKLYLTRGGYTHQEVDTAGMIFIQELHNEFERQAQEYRIDKQLTIDVSVYGTNYDATDSEHRVPVTGGGRMVAVRYISSPPANAEVNHAFSIEVPKNCDKDDELQILDRKKEEMFRARIIEVAPTFSGGLKLRMSMYVRALLSEDLDELYHKAGAALKIAGY
ncbi:MAG TPA: Fic family protein [Bacteroidota bacterium]|nr:Fic family protein [Bacteroidota bacterium]